MVRPKERIFWAAGSAVMALALIFAFAYGVTKAYRNRAVADTDSTAGELPKPKEAPLAEQASPAELSISFRQVAKLMRPTVVNISTVQKMKPQDMEGQFPQIPGFQFGLPGQPSQPFKQRGTGSGVIVSNEGYILTNNHVVGKADTIEVKLVDGRKFKGKVVGKDELSDLAVVKIESKDALPFATLGDSDGMEQGDWVVAIGSPFGLEQTLTAGIVSAKGRYVGATLNDYIQTDASINPGNSGGPLVNMQGQVIGINTMIFSESGGNQGIGFAIPSNMVRSIYKQLVSKGRVTRGYLGVTISELTPEKAKALGFNNVEGALVNDVQANTPASKAGLQSGDLIISFDGKQVKDQHELTNAVATTPVGKQAEVKFIRDGKTQTVVVETAERKIGLTAAAEESGDDSEDEIGGVEDSGKLGFSASTLNTDQASELKIKSGVVIEKVNPSSAAAEAGLRRGDVIHQINNKPIKSAADLGTATKSLKEGDVAVIQVERKGTLAFITLEVE